MQLSDTEKRMLDGLMGEPRRLAIEQQLAVGRFFDAPDFVEIAQAHLMADGEAVGEAGVRLLERLAAAPEHERRVRVPTVTDPRGVDPKACSWLKQPDHAPEREARIVRAFEAMGILLADTCINYQVVIPPVKGEHVAFGDTGSTIYANGVLGARSNFEGGCAALWAALTGRVPRYGFHLDHVRRGTRLFAVTSRPADYADWGALGGVVGRHMTSYFEVPVLAGIQGHPTSDELKHFGAALASYGSTPMFHIVGVTPEAPDLETAFANAPPAPTPIGKAEIEAFYAGSHKAGPVDCVVFAAPQLSLFELRHIADLLDGKRVSSSVALLIASPAEVVRAAERMGVAERITRAGGRILEGVCFYQMYAREMGELMGWRRLVTNSAKLTNIIQGYGFEPVLQPTARCIEAAVEGRL